MGHLVPLEDVEGMTEEIIAQGEVIPADKVKPGMLSGSLPALMHATLRKFFDAMQSLTRCPCPQAARGRRFM
jgi:hypothetical protein